MAAALSVTVVPEMEVMVVPIGTPGPVTNAPTCTALQLVTIAEVLPVVVVTFSATIILGGTVGAFQLPFGTAVCPAGVLKVLKQLV